jgi:hypothetical protein
VNAYLTKHNRTAPQVTRRTFKVMVDGKTYYYGAVRGGNGDWHVMDGGYDSGKILGYVYPHHGKWIVLPANAPTLTSIWRTLRDAVEEIVHVSLMN